MIKEVSKSELVKDVIERIKREKDFVYHDKIDDLLLVDMLRGKKYGYAKKNETVRQYTFDEEYLYAFDYDKEKDEIAFPMYLWEKDDEDSKSDYPRIILCNKEDNLDILRKKVYFFIRKYILSPLLKENEEKDDISKEIEKYMSDVNNELPDDKLIEMVTNEYNEIFNKYNNGAEQKEENEENKDNNEENVKEPEDYIKCMEKFRKDMPFEVVVRKEGNDYFNREKISLFTENAFPKFNKQLIECFDMEKINSPFKESKFKNNKYELIVKFNQESKYINKYTFNLNHYDCISFDYKPKKKEEKKEDEDEDETGKMTLEKCLKKFVKEEQLTEGDEWYCSKCKKHVLAKKKMELYYVPKILIICFKRFIKDSTFSWEKNEDEVEFPINNMDLKNFVIGPDKDHSKYDLFAVSQHYGSTGFGHYTAVCKNDGKWFSYNDSSCHETNENDCQSSAAYVLFYRRQTD
jgi:hypothetical protein